MSCYCLNSACKWSDTPSCSVDSYSPHTTAAPSAVSLVTPRRQFPAAVGVVLCRSCWPCFHLETAASTNSVTTALTARPPFSLTPSPKTPARGQGFPIRSREWRHNCVTSLSLFPGSNTILSSIILGNLNNAFLIVRYNVFVYLILYIFSWNSRYFNT